VSAVVAPGRAPDGSFREVWLITLGHSLTHWYPSTFYLLLPIIGRELGLSYSQIGLIMTCQFLAGAIANVPGGIIVDTVGRKGILMALSLFWVGFPYLLMSFSRPPRRGAATCIRPAAPTGRSWARCGCRRCRRSRC
jgi:MFS family permease